MAKQGRYRRRRSPELRHRFFTRSVDSAKIRCLDGDLIITQEILKEKGGLVYYSTQYTAQPPLFTFDEESPF